MGNVIDNSLFVDVEKFNLAVRHGRNKCDNDYRGNAG